MAAFPVGLKLKMGALDCSDAEGVREAPCDVTVGLVNALKLNLGFAGKDSLGVLAVWLEPTEIHQIMYTLKRLATYPKRLDFRELY